MFPGPVRGQRTALRPWSGPRQQALFMIVVGYPRYLTKTHHDHGAARLARLRRPSAIVTERPAVANVRL
jgi:hypothetical protein